jgi:hypothetical protein
MEDLKENRTVRKRVKPKAAQKGAKVLALYVYEEDDTRASGYGMPQLASILPDRQTAEKCIAQIPPGTLWYIVEAVTVASADDRVLQDNLAKANGKLFTGHRP